MSEPSLFEFTVGLVAQKKMIQNTHLYQILRFAIMKRALYNFGQTILFNLKSKPEGSTLTSDGKISPAEFVMAGDQLVQICPVWSWRSCPNNAKNPDLPDDKQYLIYQGIVSSERATEMSGALLEESELEGQDGWIAANHTQEIEVAKDEEEEVIDLDNYDFDTGAPKTEGNSPIRTYDIIMVYDKIMYSPHVYLKGFHNDGTPLTFEEMSEDISPEHIHRTVTFDPCAQVGQNCLAIHPCAHSIMMHKMISMMDKPDDFQASMYFFIFLKFINTIIPTFNISTPEISYSK